MNVLRNTHAIFIDIKCLLNDNPEVSVLVNELYEASAAAARDSSDLVAELTHHMVRQDNSNIDAGEAIDQLTERAKKDVSLLNDLRDENTDQRNTIGNLEMHNEDLHKSVGDMHARIDVQNTTIRSLHGQLAEVGCCPRNGGMSID